ncbi:hypothetical protein DPMN_055451 [Dreissena polymorpha]|uniref:Uncharacterized protein n=1 Tax=Dreissena polymorpha TaxID=45954 RepID=A0A9D4CRN7_DREPO|nr:hypothetical protein DPMN_055451 [Dreissena polymorpha]
MKLGQNAQDIIRTNVLAKCHEDLTINVAFRKKCPAPGIHAFQQTRTIFELIQDIITENVLTKFNKDWNINVTFKVLTTFYYSNIIINASPTSGNCHEDQTINVASRVRNAPTSWWLCFHPTRTICELVQDVIGTNLTKFHKDRIIIVASTVLTWKKCPNPFQPTGTIFELFKIS